MWALSLLDLHCGPPGPYNDVSFTAKCSHETLERLLKIALRADHDSLIVAVETAWLERLAMRAVPMDHALDAAERLHRPNFQARAYYHQILHSWNHARQYVAAIPSTTLIQGFEPVHVNRLLSGVYSLSLLWEAIVRQETGRKDWPMIRRSSDMLDVAICSCNSHSRESTTITWNSLMKDVTRTFPTPDVLGKLQAVIDKLETSTLSVVGCVCRNELQAALESLHADVKARLPEYFGITLSYSTPVHKNSLNFSFKGVH